MSDRACAAGDAPAGVRHICRLRWVCALPLWWLAACAAPSASAGEPVVGQWGGEQVQLTVDAHGGRLEAGCAFGSWRGPLQWRPDGGFSATGVFQSARGGPQAADTAPPRARFDAVPAADGLALTVSPEDGGPPQVYRLWAGRRVKLLRCL